MIATMIVQSSEKIPGSGFGTKGMSHSQSFRLIQNVCFKNRYRTGDFQISTLKRNYGLLSLLSIIVINFTSVSSHEITFIKTKITYFNYFNTKQFFQIISI